MQHLEGSGTPVLYIGRAVFKGYMYGERNIKKKETNTNTGNSLCCNFSKVSSCTIILLSLLIAWYCSFLHDHKMAHATLPSPQSFFTLVSRFVVGNAKLFNSLQIVLKTIYIVFTLGLKSDNTLGWVTGPPLTNPVVELPHLASWTGGFCSISSADDGTVILRSIAKNFGMEISPEKSETMKFLGQDRVRCEIAVDNKCLQYVQTF
jgi:hypothetical protein